MKISSIFSRFVQKIKKQLSCYHDEHDVATRACVQCWRSYEYFISWNNVWKIQARGCCMHVFLVYLIFLDKTSACWLYFHKEFLLLNQFCRKNYILISVQYLRSFGILFFKIFFNQFKYKKIFANLYTVAGSFFIVFLLPLRI